MTHPSDIAGLSKRLRAQVTSGHTRGCDGRNYSCDCGYDLSTEGLLELAATALDSLSARVKELTELAYAPDGRLHRDMVFEEAHLRGEAESRAAMTFSERAVEAQPGVMLCKMIQLATHRHAGQFDKGGRPYILHPLTVMHRLRTDDEELQCIAVGHDLLEDTETTSQELREFGFSQRIVDAIWLLTKFDDQTAESYRTSVKSNIDAIRVKIEDLRHNSDIRRLKGVTAKDIARMVRYREFYLELKAALTAASDGEVGK